MTMSPLAPIARVATPSSGMYEIKATYEDGKIECHYESSFVCALKLSRKLNYEGASVEMIRDIGYCKLKQVSSIENSRPEVEEGNVFKYRPHDDDTWKKARVE